MDLTKLNKKLLGIALSMCLTVPAFASIAISPTKIEVNANKIKGNYFTTAVDVRGDSAKPVRFKVYPGFFRVDETGDVIMLDKSNEPNDLSKKIRFVPSEFTVAQGKSQKLRVNVANLNQLPDGESRAMLYVEDVNPKEFALDTRTSGIGAQLIVKTRVGIPLYIDKGNFVKTAEIEYLNIVKENDGLYTDMKIKTGGNSRIKYTAKVQISQGKNLITEYELPKGVVAGDYYRIIKTKIPTEDIKSSGNYTLKMIVSYNDEKDKRQNLVKETNLEITGRV